MSIVLPFREEYAEGILAGRKWATLRYSPPDLDRGELVIATLGMDGPPFAILQVAGVIEAKAEEWGALEEIPGHRSYPDADRLCDHINDHYDGVNITPEMALSLVHWGGRVWEVSRINGGDDDG